MPGAKPMQAIEDRMKQLQEQGYTPSEAAAIATSKRSKRENLLEFEHIRGRPHSRRR